MLLLFFACGAAATASRADDCSATPPLAAKDYARVEAYLRRLYPATRTLAGAAAVARFEDLDYLYADRPVLAPPRAAAGRAPPLPYLPPGAYYGAPADRRKRPRWLAGAAADRWRAPVKVRRATRGAVARASTVGGRFGPAPSWTNPLALVRYPFPLAPEIREPSRPALLRAATHGAAARLRAMIASGYVEVEQFGGPRWTRSGCPPVCGTWANVWRGTGVFMKLSRPLVAPNRLAAIVELIRRVSLADHGAATLEAFAARSKPLARRAGMFHNAGASPADALAAAAADAGSGRGCRCFKEASTLNATALGAAAFLERVRAARPADWCANVCGTGAYYDRQKAPMLALDGMLATLSCLLGTDAVVLTRSPNDNGLMHQELVDFDLPESLGGWPAPPPGALNALATCAAPFANLPPDAGALLLAHWKMTGKWALSDVARQTFKACDLANPGGGADAWTSRRGRARCHAVQGDAIGADRACFVTCRGHVSSLHANVSLTQVLRPDVVLCAG